MFENRTLIHSCMMHILALASFMNAGSPVMCATIMSIFNRHVLELFCPSQPPLPAAAVAFRLYRDDGVLVLRSKHFQSHDLKYLIHLNRKAALAPTPTLTSYTCLRVPHHLQQLDWSELIDTEAAKQLQDQLRLVENCKVMDILGKMESPQFIHTYLVRPAAGGSSTAGQQQRGGRGLGATAVMRFELARYGLEFELREGQLLSCDYQGYQLRAQQQLVGVGGASSGDSAMPGAAADVGADSDSDVEGDHMDTPCLENLDPYASSSQSSMSTSAGSSKKSSSSSSSLDEMVSEAVEEHEGAASEVLYTLPEFRQYLVLDRMEGTGVVLGAGKADTLVLVPATGTGVACDSGGHVVMELSQGSGAKLKV